MNEITLTIDGKIYRLTNMNNGNKYDRAVKEAGANATPKQILAHYDKHAGYIQDEDSNKIINGKFWEEEKTRLGNELNDLVNKSDEELEVIIRRAENINISGSLFQRAENELKLRDRRSKKIEPRKDRWWEKTWVQIIMFIGAIAGIVGLIALL